MNNKFGRDPYYPENFHRDRRAGEPLGNRFDQARGQRSPDQELETSGPYRQPGQPYGYGSRPSQRRESGGWSSEVRGGYAGRGPKGYTRTDQRIREDVCDGLSWSDEVGATDIIVRVENGEVTLEGSVETRHMKRLAEDIAEDVPGVTDVHNTVRVKKPMLTEIKEKLMGETDTAHYANTGTRTPSSDAVSTRNGSL